MVIKKFWLLDLDDILKTEDLMSSSFEDMSL